MSRKLEYIPKCYHKQGYYSRQSAENSLRPVMNYYGGIMRLKITRCEVCNLWIHVRIRTGER